MCSEALKKFSTEEGFKKGVVDVRDHTAPVTVNSGTKSTDSVKTNSTSD